MNNPSKTMPKPTGGKPMSNEELAKEILKSQKRNEDLRKTVIKLRKFIKYLREA